MIYIDNKIGEHYPLPTVVRAGLRAPAVRDHGGHGRPRVRQLRQVQQPDQAARRLRVGVTCHV